MATKTRKNPMSEDEIRIAAEGFATGYKEAVFAFREALGLVKLQMEFTESLLSVMDGTDPKALDKVIKLQKSKAMKELGRSLKYLCSII